MLGSGCIEHDPSRGWQILVCIVCGKSRSRRTVPTGPYLYSIQSSMRVFVSKGVQRPTRRVTYLAGMGVIGGHYLATMYLAID